MYPLEPVQQVFFGQYNPILPFVHNPTSAVFGLASILQTHPGSSNHQAGMNVLGET
jgi:hypothetical protein